MPAGSKEIKIDKYIISHDVTIGNTIWLYSGGSVVGSVFFVPKGKVVPPSIVKEMPFMFNLYYEIDRYPDIIDTLRYEKPLYVFVSWNASDVVAQGSIRSGNEPVGEQEGQGTPLTP